MKRKKSPGSVFQWTVITVLTLVAVYLTHDFRRARVLMATAPVPTSRISADGGDSAETRRSGGTSASLGSSNEAKAILERTIERIESLKSVTAKIDMRVRVGKVSVDGNGKYEELFLPSNDSQQHSRTLCYGGTSLFRLHLELPRNAAADEQGEDDILDIVCDKNTLWTYTSIEGSQRLTELKLGEMAAVLARAAESDEVCEQIALNHLSFPSPLSGFPGLGGITGVLRRLLTCYEFPDKAETVSLKGKDGSLRAWRVSGRLRPDVYEKSVKNLLEYNTGERKAYLDQFPCVVEIYISQQYEFPYRLCYFSSPEMNLKKKKKLVTIDLTDVYENHFSVVPENFIYSPGGLTSTDVTHSYIEKLLPGFEF